MNSNVEVKWNQKSPNFLNYQDSDATSKMDTFSKNGSAGSFLSIKTLTKGIKLLEMEEKEIEYREFQYFCTIWNNIPTLENQRKRWIKNLQPIFLLKR